jgi:hypothetical protein
MGIKFVHKIFLGVLVGMLLGLVGFFISYNFVVSTNAIAVAASAPAPGPYNPPWAFPLSAFGLGFVVPIAGIISMDMSSKTGRSKFVHKIFLGVLTGMVVGLVGFMASFNFITSTNAIAVAAGAPAPGPYNPPWAMALAVFGIGFIVPIAGIISMDFDEREQEMVKAAQAAAPSTTV